MSEATDDRFFQLYHDFAQSIRGYENAIKDRRRIRARLTQRRRSTPPPRRPVGSPSDFRISPEPSHRLRPTRKPAVHSFYLGPILGWMRLSANVTAVEESPDPTAEFSSSELFDSVSLRLYWNAKQHYETCRRKFFDHVQGPEFHAARREAIASHREVAKGEYSHAANLQLLGAEEMDESGLDRAREEVASACQAFWGIYETTPDPKSVELKTELLAMLAEAQMAGLGDTKQPIVAIMTAEVNRLLNNRELESENS